MFEDSFEVILYTVPALVFGFMNEKMQDVTIWQYSLFLFFICSIMQAIFFIHDGFSVFSSLYFYLLYLIVIPIGTLLFFLQKREKEKKKQRAS